MHIRIQKPSAKFLIALLLGALLIVGTILTIREVQRQQEVRQHAAAPTTCSVNQPTDTMLVFDKSPTMQGPTSASDSTPRFTTAKQAATKFVDIIDGQDTTQSQQIGLVSFASEADTTLDSPLTSNLDQVKTAINAISLKFETCLECAAKLTNDEFVANGRPNVKHVAILLSDGKPTRYIGIHPGPYTDADYKEAEVRTLAEIQKGYEQSGITYFVVGFGTDVNTTFLKQIATTTGGKYFFAPTATDLKGIFDEISTIIGKGSISGTAYNDLNGNGVLDADEPKLSGWTMNLYGPSVTVIDPLSTPASDSLPQTTQTAADGTYTFSGICDGSYLVKQTVKSGWNQTFPQQNGGQAVTITNGVAESSQDFGNSQQVLGCPVSKAVCQWDATSGATSYQVIVSELFPGTTKSPVQLFTQQVQDALFYTFDAKPGSTYQCRVSAVNSCGNGPQGIVTDSCPVPPTPTNTPSVTPTGTLSPTVSPTVTNTPSPTITTTPSVTPTGTLSPTMSPTITPTPTRTPTPTATNTPTPTVTNTPTPSRTPTPTNTPTRPPVPTSPPNPTQPPAPTNVVLPTPTTVFIAQAPSNTPFPTGVPIPSNTPGPTLVTGDNTASTFIGIAAAVLTVLGGVMFILL